jgi:hypothetical protein
MGISWASRNRVPSLPTLRHDNINPAGDGSARLLGAADRGQDESVGIVDLVDVAGRVVA